MAGISKIVVAEKEIIVLDYRALKESEMIKLQQQGANHAVSSHKQVRILSLMDDNNFITPRFVSETEKILKELEPLDVALAIVGLSGPKLWILKGLNLLRKKPILLFQTEDEAIDFLVRC